MADKQALARALLDLDAALTDAPADEQTQAAIAELIEDSDLPDGDVVPTWMIDMLHLVSKRTTTQGWVPFKLRGLDDSDALDLLRGLHASLPIDFEDNEESWLLRFPRLGVEAAISFEGPVYRVSPLGGTWDDTRI